MEKIAPRLATMVSLHQFDIERKMSCVQRQRKVGVEARQEYEQGGDEVVDCGRPGVGRQPDGYQVNDGHDGAAEVGAQHHGPPCT